MHEQLEFVGFWKRVGVALIDAALWLPLWPLFAWANDTAWQHGTVLHILALDAAYSFAVVALVHYYGGTPGKLILRMRVIGRDLQYLSWNRSVRREAINYASALLTSLPLWWTFRHIEPSNYDAGEQARLLETHAGWALTYVWPGIVQCIDVGWVATNRRRRAIHDYIAGSYVVTKRSLHDALAHQPLSSGAPPAAGIQSNPC